MSLECSSASRAQSCSCQLPGALDGWNRNARWHSHIGSCVEATTAAISSVLSLSLVTASCSKKDIPLSHITTFMSFHFHVWILETDYIGSGPGPHASICQSWTTPLPKNLAYSNETAVGWYRAISSLAVCPRESPEFGFRIVPCALQASFSRTNATSQMWNRQSHVGHWANWLHWQNMNGKMKL